MPRQHPVNQQFHVGLQQQVYVEPHQQSSSHGVLIDCAPPPYSAVVDFPLPTSGDKDYKIDQLESPPPYPG